MDYRRDYEADNYLVYAANHMFWYLAKDEPTQSDLIKAAQLGCATLRRIAEEKPWSFRTWEVRPRTDEDEDEITWSERQRTDKALLRRILTETGHFAKFLRAEKKALIIRGVNPELAEEIIRLLEDLREQISRADETDSQSMYRDLEHLGDGICSIEREMAREEARQKRRAELKRRLKWGTFGVAGTVIVGVNAGAWAASLGFSTAGSTVSIVLGSNLVATATKEFLKDAAQEGEA